MRDQDWIKALADDTKVKFTYQELPDGGAFITAQIEGNRVVFSVFLTKIEKTQIRETVESHFEGELSKR
jgi:hypothetical protein